MMKHIKLTLLFTLAFALFLQAASAFEFRNNFDGNGRPTDIDFDTTDRAFWQMKDGWLGTGNGMNLITGADGFSLGTVNVSGSNQWISYQVQTRFYMSQPTGNVALVARYKDRRNYYRAVIEITPNSRALKLDSVVAGRVRNLATLDLNAQEYTAPKIANTTAAEAVSFAFLVENDNLTVKINGTNLIRTRDGNLTMGTAGLGQRQNEVFFDFLEVASPEDATPMATPEASGTSVFSVQLTSTRNIADARGLLEQLRSSGFSPFMIEEDGLQKIMLGRFASSDEATKMRVVMVSEGFTLARVVDLSDRPEVADVPETTEPIKIEDLPTAILDEAGWDRLTPQQQKQVAELVARQTGSGQSSQTVSEILEIKRQIESLSQEQKKFINLFESDKAEREQIIEQTRRLSQDFERAMNNKDYAYARELIERVNMVNAASPMSKIMKDRLDRQLEEERQQADRTTVMREINLLKVEAQSLTQGSPSLQQMKQAREKWQTVMVKAPWDQQSVDQANSQIQQLNSKIDALEEQAAQDRARELDERAAQRTNMIWVALGVGAILIVLFVIVTYIAGRRHYKRMMQQMREEALAPLEDLRRQARLGSQETMGVEYHEAQGMLEQTDDSSAEYMVPRKAEQAPAPEPPVEQPSTAPAAEAVPAPQPAPAAPQPAPVVAPVAPADEEDEDEAISFGDFSQPEVPQSPPETEPEPQVPEPVQAQAAEEPEIMEFDEDAPISFDLDDDLSFETAPANVQPPREDEEELSIDDSMDDLVFDFDDTVAQDVSEAAPEAPVIDTELVPEPPKQEAPVEFPEYDITDAPTIHDASQLQPAPAPETPESPAPEAPEAEAPTPPSEAPTMAQAPRTAASMFTPPGQPQPEQPPQATEPQVAPATPPVDPEKILHRMEMSNTGEGAMPEGWAGEQTEFANVELVEAPDGSGEKCIRFRKSSGSAPTAFAYWFDAARGKFNIDFQLRCDEKNKHLLGLYFEADADFRRSIHTVVQSSADGSNAHLRVFTRPTPYTMGEWAQVHYEVDLAEGLVDGYVNGQLIAEGIRMGMSTDKINVLSIRDNADTTGTLYLKDFIISKP